jgi:hypothetical protein
MDGVAAAPAVLRALAVAQVNVAPVNGIPAS